MNRALPHQDTMTPTETRPPDAQPFTAPPEVGVGEDGWLFFLDRRAAYAALYSWHPVTLWKLLKWRSLILARIDKAQALGARYLEFIVPDKMSIHQDKFPEAFPPSRNSLGRRLGLSLPRRSRRENWVDAFPVFVSEGRRRDLFYKTDTHLCAAGYMLGYRVLCDACGVAPAPHVLDAAVELHPAVLDLGIKCDPPIEAVLEVLVYPQRARRIAQNELVTFREQSPAHIVGTSFGSVIVMRNDHPQADPRTIVVFGDSHLFRGLGPMLSESFREVHLLWASPIDWGYVERVRPAILLHQLTERYLRRLPVDGFDIEAFAAERLEVARSHATPPAVPVTP